MRGYPVPREAHAASALASTFQPCSEGEDNFGGSVPILDWMTRGDDVLAAARVPYRMLEAVPGLDGGDGDPANMLIQDGGFLLVFG